METLAFIIPTLWRQMWEASLDLKDGYFYVPISLVSQRFLAFKYQVERFKFTALPFRLSTSPRVFTRVAEALVPVYNSRGLHQQAGGTRFPQLRLKMWSFPLWCLQHISVRASHIEGKDNTLADVLFRG